MSKPPKNNPTATKTGPALKKLVEDAVMANGLLQTATSKLFDLTLQQIKADQVKYAIFVDTGDMTVNLTNVRDATSFVNRAKQLVLTQKTGN